jgi:hypothetical protein
MRITITIDTGEMDASLDAHDEVVRLVHEAAERIDDEEHAEGESFALTDESGNAVGSVTFGATVPDPREEVKARAIADVLDDNPNTTKH